MDNIKNIDIDKNINYSSNNKTVDTSSNIISNDKKVSNNDVEEIENTESYQNIPNTYSVNDVEEVDLSIFEE